MADVRPTAFRIDLHDKGLVVFTESQVKANPQFTAELVAHTGLSKERLLNKLFELSVDGFFNKKSRPLGNLRVTPFYMDDGITTTVTVRGEAYTVAIKGPNARVYHLGPKIAERRWDGSTLIPSPGNEPGPLSDELFEAVEERLALMSDWPLCKETGRKARRLDNGQRVTIIGERPTVADNGDGYEVLIDETRERHGIAAEQLAFLPLE